MKAITIWQPWASLIVAGAKPYEFRGWEPPRSIQGQRIAIHAGARAVKPAEVADLLARLQTTQAWTTALRAAVALPLLERWRHEPGLLPLSSIIGSAVLGKPKRAFDIAGEFGGTLNDSDRYEHCNWAWPLTEVAALEPIAPAKGHQGFWDWEPGA